MLCNPYIDSMHTPILAGEYQWMFGTLIMGKIYKFPYPHVIRIFHGKNLSIQNSNHPYEKFTTSLLSDYWHQDAKLFIKLMAERVLAYSNYNQDQSYSMSEKLLLEIVYFRYIFLLKMLPLLEKYFSYLKLLLTFLKYSLKSKSSYEYRLLLKRLNHPQTFLPYILSSPT